MSIETRHHLKRPLLVYILAICFLAAPMGNIIASMIGFGVYHWYSPSAFIRFVQNISALDRGWLLLNFLAGLSLLNQRKWSWILAIVALVLTSVFNFHYGMEYSSDLSTGAHFFPVLFMLSNLAVVAILYHFRFPYLDRREAWWGIYPRFRCQVPVRAEGFSGLITNISRSGAFATGSGLKMGAVIQLQFGSISDLEAEVVHVSDTGFGLEFNPKREQTRQIKQFVRDLAAAPVGESAPV